MLGAQPSPWPLCVPGLAKEPQSRKVAEWHGKQMLGGMIMAWKGGEFRDCRWGHQEGPGVQSGWCGLLFPGGSGTKFPAGGFFLLPSFLILSP